MNDFQIASIAIANGLTLYTINVDDFAGIEGLDVRRVSPSTRRAQTSRLGRGLRHRAHAITTRSVAARPNVSGE